MDGTARASSPIMEDPVAEMERELAGVGGANAKLRILVFDCERMSH